MSGREVNRNNLGKLFSPKSVAIVGASEGRHYSQSLIDNLRRHGFAESNIFPVNPKYETISGLRCFPTLEDLGAAPDVVAVLIGHDHVSGVIESAGKIGVGAALVIADGYADESEEGRLDQVELGNLANKYGISMLGPNTLGYIRPSSNAGMWCAGALQTPLIEGGISVVAQSSGMLNVIMGMLGDRQIGVQACVSIGNAAVVGLPEMVSYFAADSETRVIGLVVESIDRPREFAEALEAAQRNQKPVVVLKIGASERGQRNSLAHTGRLSSPNQGWRAVFDRFGVCGAFDIDDFVETITLFDGLKKKGVARRGDSSRLGVAFATISGGETSLICDIADQEHLELAVLSADTLAVLRGGLNKATLIGNPLDLQNSRTARPDTFWQSLRTLAGDSAVDVLALRLNMTVKPSQSLISLYREIVDLVCSADVVPLILSRAYERFDLSWWDLFRELDVSFVMSYRNAVRAIARFDTWLNSSGNVGTTPQAIPAEAGASRDGGSVPLSLAQARTWLSNWGISYVPAGIADDRESAASVANQLGYPVVVKAVMPNMVHKSDVGGVVLNLEDEDSVIGACLDMRHRLLGEAASGEGLLSFEVQKMMASGVEVILGMKQDPTWGPLLMVGSGGIYAEILRDMVWVLPPISPEAVTDALEKLRIWPMLNGVRGHRPADIRALSQLISLFGDALVRDGAWISSMDLNPVIVGPDGSGAYVVDVAMFGDEKMVEYWSV
ncbi:MAG: acetate--CoA ligase family protein [Acidimicrobiaceae bacterium]|nr:acetate--CoA ligase family protein [Acidimicrobiaceae bacterium]